MRMRINHILNALKKMIGSNRNTLKEDQNSIGITDEALINAFINNPDFPYMVSFPRTGSHWLRMLMELYFEMPSLTRSFYYQNPKHFTCYHHHDIDLQLKRKNVIYLFREPVATVFSQMNYYKEDLNNETRIVYWSDLYAAHLRKWLIDDQFTNKKTVIRYENLKNNLEEEFKKVCDHFKVEFISDKLKSVSLEVSKEKLKKKTAHDNQVVNLSVDYERNRENFFEHYKSLILARTIDLNIF